MNRQQAILLIDNTLNPLFLNEENFCVTMKNSVSEGQNILESTLFDCIIYRVDITLEEKILVCKNLKSNENTKNIPLIIMNLNSELDNDLLLLKEGCDFSVPFNEDTRILNHKIQILLRLYELQNNVTNLKKTINTHKLLASYNHDFNNPLAIASGNLYYLRSTLKEKEQIIRGDRVYEALERMTTIIRKIRDMKENIDDSR